MNRNELKKLLEEVRQGKTEIDDALAMLQDFSFKDLGYAKIDNQREIRTGYPEIIFCSGKSIEQMKGIIEYMNKRD